MTRKLSLNIGSSSTRCWLFLNGDMKNPIRAFSDANGDVVSNIVPIIENGKHTGEKSDGEMQHVEYNKNHIVESRLGWEEYFPIDAHKKYTCKPGNSPFIKQSFTSTP